MDDLLLKQTKFYYVRAWTVVKGEKTAGQRWLLGPGASTQQPRRGPHLDGVLCVGGFVHTSLAHGVGAHTDVLLDLIAVGEVDVVPV